MSIPKEIMDKIDAKWRLTKDENLRQAAIFGYQLATDGRESWKEVFEKYKEETGSSAFATNQFCQWLEKNYPTDGREELEKENVELKRSILAGLKKEGELQSSLKEKEKELSESKLGIQYWSLKYGNKCNELEGLKAENERLQKIIDIVNDRPDL